MKINIQARKEKEEFNMISALKNLCPNEKIEIPNQRFEEISNIQIHYRKKKEKKIAFSTFFERKIA